MAAPRSFDPRAREARQRAYQAVPTLAEQMPGVDEIAMELRFLLGNGQQQASPYKRIFVADMQAFFELRCPDPDCSGRGFDLSAAVQDAVRAQGRSSAGTVRCLGSKQGQPCEMSLQYTITVRLRGAG